MFTWPLGRDPVVMARVTGLVVSVRFAVAVRGGLLESAAMKTSGTPVAATVGVPVIIPFAASKDKPGGSVPPVSDHMYGFVPPRADSVAEYEVFTCPAGSEVVLIANATDEMVRVNVAVAVCGERLESLT